MLGGVVVVTCVVLRYYLLRWDELGQGFCLAFSTFRIRVHFERILLIAICLEDSHEVLEGCCVWRWRKDDSSI